MEQDCKSTNSQSLKLEDILTRENLNKALNQVVANKGAPGVDGISTTDIKGLLRANEGALAQALKQSVLKGKYRPKAVKRVWIPKGERKSTTTRHTNSNRPTNPTSGSSEVARSLRTKVFRRKFWVST